MSRRDLWYENAIVYCLDVETFMDANGDGVGDFIGLTRRLDYLSSLGVTCLWLLPFYPSPNRDDGYDVTDYFATDPRYGTLGDFVDFIGEARDRGIRVIADLVANHTSDEHPWFQAARSDPASPYRDFYVWRADDPGDTGDAVVFPGEQAGIWTYDERAGAYYLHRFHDFQPDLNILDPVVQEQINRIMGLWLQLGVAGFRVDAAPFLIGLTGLEHRVHPDDPHVFLRELRDFLQTRTGNGVLLGEVDLGLASVADYFGGGNELQLLFNFILNRYIFLALVEESADPLRLGLQELPAPPGSGQWLTFLRHHDELNLSLLTARQRDEIMHAFGPDPAMQIYGRGLRRRLAPMLGGDRRRIELAYSLAFSLPGTPMIYYGDEIGMGENLALPGRLSVRTPMQWSDAKNSGFSSADERQLVRPVVSGNDFGYERVNVAQQRADPLSLLNWMARLIRARKETPEFGWGTYRVIDAGHPAVFIQRSDYDGNAAIAIHNLSRKPATIRLNVPDDELDACVDVFCSRQYEPLSRNQPEMTLDGYAYRWLRIDRLGRPDVSDDLETS